MDVSMARKEGVFILSKELLQLIYINVKGKSKTPFFVKAYFIF